MNRYAEKAKSIHEDNIKAGWWVYQNVENRPWETELTTRNIGELLCLVHSELSEAWEGHSTNAHDDKLPDRLMFEVEIGDTAIRVYDILGYYHALQNYAPEYVKFDFTFPVDLDVGISDYLLAAHQLTSTAMEGFRKNDVAKGLMNLNWLLDLLYQIADEWQFDLPATIETKREFNRNRADHKPENRAMEGGKKW